VCVCVCVRARVCVGGGCGGTPKLSYLYKSPPPPNPAHSHVEVLLLGVGCVLKGGEREREREGGGGGGCMWNRLLSAVFFPSSMDQQLSIDIIWSLLMERPFVRNSGNIFEFIQLLTKRVAFFMNYYWKLKSVYPKQGKFIYQFKTNMLLIYIYKC